MSIASSFRGLNRLSVRTNPQGFNSGRLEHNSQCPVLVSTSIFRAEFSTSSYTSTDAREDSIRSSSEDQILNPSSINVDKHEHGSHEVHEFTSSSTTHSPLPSPSSPPPLSPPPSSSLPPPYSNRPPIPQSETPPSRSALLSFSPLSLRPPRSSLSQSNLISPFSPANLHSPSENVTSSHRVMKRYPAPSVPPPTPSSPVAPKNVHLSSASSSSSETRTPKSIAQQLIDYQNDPVAIRRLANWLMQDRNREKDFKDWGLICRMCPPDLAIRMLSSPHAYGFKPLQKLPNISSQAYHLRSIISKLVLSHPNSSGSSSSASSGEATSYSMMHDPNKLIPLLKQFLKLSELHLPGDPYILLLALRAYASFPGIGDSGRAKVIELIHANKASWWSDPSFKSMNNDHEEFSAAHSPSLDSQKAYASLRNQRFEDVNRHRLTDLDAWTILKQVDRLRLLSDLDLEVCSSWDRQPVPAPLRKQRLRLVRPLQQLERLSDDPSLSDQAPPSASSNLERIHRPAIVPYEQIAKFIAPALYQAPTDPIVLLFSMYLLHLTSVPGNASLRTLSAQALSPNGVEREVRGGFDNVREMSETYRLLKKAMNVLKDVWGDEEEALWEAIKSDLRSQVIEAEKVRHDRAKGKVGSLKRMS